MSIQQVQTKNILELIAQSFFVNGINPQSMELYNNLSRFFSDHPTGVPFTDDLNTFRNDNIADEQVVNDFMALMIVNIDTVYEVCANHVEQIMMLNTLLRTHLDRLKIKRRVLENRIDDYLLGLYNSDGYFYSFSDTFSDTEFVDFQYSSCFVDTSASTISIPSISSASTNISPGELSDPNIKVSDGLGNVLSWQKKSEFANAIDGLTNTAWYIEVRTTNFEPVICNLQLQLAHSNGDTIITRIDATPYGIAPVQVGINASFIGLNNLPYSAPFTNMVKTSVDKMTFIGDQVNSVINSVDLQLLKTEPDYIEDEDIYKVNVYIFGFKELLFTEQFYDPSAVLVSQAFGIPTSLQEEAVIDSVSMTVDDYIPTNTSIKYYVAEDNIEASELSDFDWKEISPVSANGDTQNHVINFNGSFTTTSIARRTQRLSSDVKLIELNTTNVDLAKRNPTPSYIPGLDVYRLMTFAEKTLAGTLKLEEGINTTRIFHTALDPDALSEGFAWWKEMFDNGAYFTTYGETDAGHEFFYGADVGEDGRSIYAETFIETMREYPVFLKECRKSDFNSRTWAVRIFLNGREIANMPVGVDKLTIPWKLKEGNNHIVLMVNIPETTAVNPSPYIGTFEIMADTNLSDYGTVKLDNWTYVDLYKFQNNQVNEPNSFTIYNEELISRKKPTNNFRISYKKEASTSPALIRLRADLDRSSQHAMSTPILDSYRIRFSYS